MLSFFMNPKTSSIRFRVLQSCRNPHYFSDQLIRFNLLPLAPIRGDAKLLILRRMC